MSCRGGVLDVDRTALFRGRVLRERAPATAGRLTVVMVLVGLLFAARMYPVVTVLWHWDDESMAVSSRTHGHARDRLCRTYGARPLFCIVFPAFTRWANLWRANGA
jgi:hypothetical protein